MARKKEKMSQKGKKGGKSQKKDMNKSNQNASDIFTEEDIFIAGYGPDDMEG